MKSLILVAVLAALTVCFDAASVLPPYQEETIFVEESDQAYTKCYDEEGALGRSGLVDPTADLILFYEEHVSIQPNPQIGQVREVVYHGNSTTRIRVIRISRLPPVPGHTEMGMLGTHAYVRFLTAPGQGLETRVQFYGDYTDWL